MPRLKTLPADNPVMRRFKGLDEATRHADRCAKRTDRSQFVYEVATNPRFAVVPGDHPIQQSFENGTIQLGGARLAYTAHPTENPKVRVPPVTKGAQETDHDYVEWKDLSIGAKTLLQQLLASKEHRLRYGKTETAEVAELIMGGYVGIDPDHMPPKFIFLTRGGAAALHDQAGKARPKKRRGNPWKHTGGGCLVGPMAQGKQYPCDDDYEETKTGEMVNVETTRDGHFGLPTRYGGTLPTIAAIQSQPGVKKGSARRWKTKPKKNPGVATAMRRLLGRK